jgi:hypothetical protein
MTREELRKHLVDEISMYRSLFSYDAVAALSGPLKHHFGNPGTSEFYQVDARVLQRWNRDNEDWIELLVSVDDGVPHGAVLGRMFNVIAPESGSLVFHRDGRIETVLRD